MFEQYDVVRIVRLLRPLQDYDDWKVNKRNPKIGDVGTVVEILQTSNQPLRFVIEAVDTIGQTVWLSDFLSDELELTE